MFEVFAPQIPVIGVSTERFIALLFAASAGGMFGAALSALPSFISTGFVVLLGETAGIVTRQSEGTDLITTGELGTGIIDSIGLDPLVGSHIALAGGVAASAYAGKWYADMDPNEGGYHFGRDITHAFGMQPDILAVGGLFGTLGLLISRIVGGIGLPLDSAALSVTMTTFIACIAFGYPLIGPPADSGLLDMSPLEKETMCGDGSGWFATEPQLPHQYKRVNIVVIGLGAGVLGGWTWLITESLFLTYGISAVSLLLLNLGVEKISVTHHITLGGSVFGAIAAPMVGGSEPLIIAANAVGGLIGALLGGVIQRVAHVHSGTHMDPSVMPITIYSLLIGVLLLLGVIPNSAYLGL